MKTLIFAIVVVLLIWGARKKIRYNGTNPFGEVALTYTRFWGIWRRRRIYRWNEDHRAWMDIENRQPAAYALQLVIRRCIDNDPLAQPPMSDDAMRRFIEEREKQYAEHERKRQKGEASGS